MDGLRCWPTGSRALALSGIVSVFAAEELTGSEFDRAPWPPYHPLRQDPPRANEVRAEAADLVAEPLPQPPSPARQKRVRILLADDHETVRTGVRVILNSHEEYEVIDVANGVDALAELQRTDLDLVILDLTMPGLDGFTVAQEIRKHSPDIPILFFSMHQSSPSLLSLARSRRVQGFVCKSESGVVLLQAVEALLAKKEFFPSEP